MKILISQQTFFHDAANEARTIEMTEYQTFLDFDPVFPESPGDGVDVAPSAGTAGEEKGGGGTCAVIVPAHSRLFAQMPSP